MIGQREDRPGQARRLNQTHVPKAPEAWCAAWFPVSLQHPSPRSPAHSAASMDPPALSLPLGQWGTSRESGAEGKWQEYLSPCLSHWETASWQRLGSAPEERGCRPGAFSKCQCLPTGPRGRSGSPCSPTPGALPPLVGLPSPHLRA